MNFLNYNFPYIHIYQLWCNVLDYIWGIKNYTKRKNDYDLLWIRWSSFVIKMILFSEKNILYGEN